VADREPLLEGALDSAAADQSAANERAADGVSDASEQAGARTAEAFGRGRTGVAAATSGAAGSLSVSFADIQAMTTSVSQNTEAAARAAERMLPIAVRDAFVQSAVLSPVTFAQAEAAVLAGAARIGVHVALSTGLGIVAVTIVTTYELADAALQVGAAGLSFVVGTAGTAVAGSVDVTVAVVAGTADVVTTAVEGTVVVTIAGVQTVVAAHLLLRTLQLTLAMAATAAASALAQETIEAFLQGFPGAVDELVADPWLMLVAPLALPALAARNTVDNWDGDDLLEDTIDAFETQVGVLGPGYDALIAGLMWETEVLFGWEDGGSIYGSDDELRESVLSTEERSERFDRFLLATAEVYAQSGREAPAGMTPGTPPTDLESLVLTMGEIDALGAEDEAVIRVITVPGTPPTFTLVIPSTQQWIPGGDGVPNDIVGNLNIVLGDSQLLHNADQALAAAQAQYARDTGYTGPMSQAPVMVSGFSQGGIASGEFAEQYGDRYNVTQVVTVGAGLGRADIADDVSVIAYESPDDPVPGLDAARNDPRFDTIDGDNGGGLASHNAARYARLAAEEGRPTRPNNLDTFFGDTDGAYVTDYHSTKD
jgi:hypothetical protein